MTKSERLRRMLRLTLRSYVERTPTEDIATAATAAIMRVLITYDSDDLRAALDDEAYNP
jgi:hypothetical protein